MTVQPFSATAPIKALAGSNTKPSITFTGNTGSGLYSPGANKVAITTGGTQRLLIDENGSITVSNKFSVPLGTQGLPSIFFGSDTNTGLYSPGADQLALSTNGTERARIDSSGRFLVGTSTARANFDNATSTTGALIESSSNQSASMGIVTNSNSGASNGGRLILARSEGTVPGSNALVVNNDKLGIISYQGHDGTEFVESARIAAEVDGTPGANDMPGRLVFSTCADGASSPTEQLRITSDRYVRLASGSGGIQFNGDTAAANALDDYEEGTWTPVHSDAANTTATLTGLYRKIGNLVYLRISATGTGTLKVGSVSGLPFTNIATIVGRGGKVNHITSATSDNSVVGYQANAAVINLNLSADVSVSVGASWVASITSVTF